MSDTSLDTAALTGRPVRLEPTAPGFWMVTIGVVIAALSPLFGFLIGVMSKRPQTSDAIDPLYLGLFSGVIVGGVGVVLAVAGGMRLWRHHKTGTPASDQTAGASAATDPVL